MTHFFSIGIIALFAAMLPGPDFAIVTRNNLLYSKQAGLYTTLGIASAIIIHMTYCLLGIAVIISQSIVAFSMIKYLGGAYLIYIGIKTLISKSNNNAMTNANAPMQQKQMARFTAWRQGFLCNLLNPKATLFFLAVFTVMVSPQTPLYIQLGYATEMVLASLVWFTTLTFILTHPIITHYLNKTQRYISKILGASLIGFGVVLCLLKQSTH